MNAGAPIDCVFDTRRGRLFGNSDWNGIDFVDVSEDQKSLCVHFFNGVPKGIGLANIKITGGRRIPDVRPVRVFLDQAHDADLDDCLRVELDKAGDLSTYRLCLVGEGGKPMRGIDPRYACVEFRFRLDCAGDVDCLPSQPRENVPAEPIEIDYLAKDYASFLRLIYDRLALVMPDWKERHAPDLGVTLVEILAYAADYLSYYQDAVATEAYLDTARRRVSVRRHLRLIDYQLHEGCNARGFVSIEFVKGEFSARAGDLFFSTDPAGAARQGSILSSATFGELDGEGCELFEPVLHPETEISFRAEHSRILIHDWGDEECCLPKGATRATLVDGIGREAGEDVEPAWSVWEHDEPKRDLALKVGDYLIFEEVIGPMTGNPADADPVHRHVVRLTSVEQGYDALLDVSIVEVGWAQEDALPFRLCISVRRAAPDCDLVRPVTVARANIIPVDHGRTRRTRLGIPDEHEVLADCACEGSIVESVSVPVPFEPCLEEAPLTFAESIDLTQPASVFLMREPRSALPSIFIEEESETATRWLPRRDLLSSDGSDRHFVVEIGDESRACIRFGNGEHGQMPVADVPIAGHYRIGNGAAGNVERESIALMMFRDSSVDAGKVTVRNPLPTSGGTAPETQADAKLVGPGSILARRERAIVAEDYAELASRLSAIQGAAARPRWSGSWYEMQVGIDPVAETADFAALPSRVTTHLVPYCRIGHDLAVVMARSIPIFLKLEVCVRPSYVAGHVRAALLEVFGAGRTSTGRPGFFHPDRLRFGEDIHVSRIVAAAMEVPGVESARVKVLRRMNRADEGVLASGRLAIGPHEIARLDNDPNFPENGHLDLKLGGGR